MPIAWWICLRANKRKGVRIAILYTLIACATIAPWTIRNAIVTGHFVPISTNGGVNFYIGHNEDFDYWSTGAKTTIREQTDLDEVEESALFFRLGTQFMMENPGQDFLNNVKKIGYLYSTTWKPWPWFNYGRELRFAGGIPIPVWPWGWPAIVILLIAFFLCLVRKKELGVLYACVLLQTFSCIVFFARARFRLPLIPIFSIVFALGVVSTVELIRQRRVGRRCASHPE